jgi:hypothetical protein
MDRHVQYLSIHYFLDDEVEEGIRGKLQLDLRPCAIARTWWSPPHSSGICTP